SPEYCLYPAPESDGQNQSYNLHIGGNRNGTRIPRMYRENITESEILDSLDELVGRWAKEREAGEGFGDFTVRAGIIRPVLDPARDFWE
ncbi:hypothetical protein ACLBP9_22150, partial [Klebsiella pneumoniae]